MQQDVSFRHNPKLHPRIINTVCMYAYACNPILFSSQISTCIPSYMGFPLSKTYIKENSSLKTVERL